MDLSPDAVRAEVARLAPEAQRLLVAVSGGADSLALLHLLSATGLTVSVGHVDHRLRPDSGADARAVEAAASRYGLPCEVVAVDVAAVATERGWNLEAAARTLRYQQLHRMAKRAGADVVAVAHTGDDQAETVLMQLLRGAAYLRGMPSRRGRLIRPLLGVRRAELRELLEGAGVAWRDDPTNRDAGRLRGWLRLEVIPLLEGRAPGLVDRLARTAEVQRDVADYLADEAERRFGKEALAASALVAAPPALQREVAAALLHRHELAVDRARIERILDQIREGAPRRASVAPGVSVRLLGGRVEIVEAPTTPPESLPADGSNLPIGVPDAVLDALPDLEVRAPRPGDRIALPGGTRKVSDVLIDAGVPREERPELTVLAEGDRVHWIEGLARSAALRDLGVPHPDPELPAMLRALALADRAALEGELPVGAVVLLGGDVVGEGWNRTEAEHDPSAHAEIAALRAAAQAVGDWRLEGASLVVTLEPCPMCFGAALQAHVGRIVYGAENRREGALGSVVDLSAAPWKRVISVRRGLLAREARARLERFFAARRSGGDRIRGSHDDAVS